MLDSSKFIVFLLVPLLATLSAIATEQDLARYAKLPDDAILVSVNDRALTKGCYEGLVQAKLTFGKGKRKLSEKQLANLEKSFRKAEYQNFIPIALFATEALKLGLKPTDHAREELRTKYARAWGKPNESFDALCSRLTPLERNAITNFFELDLLNRTYISTTMATQLVVSAEQISNQVALTVAYNARMALTNQIAFAQASNVLARARAGADFAELADEYSQDEQMEPGGDLGFCTSNDFSLEAPSYWENIVCLKPGEITDVMTSEGGIEIVKFIGDKEDVNGDGSLIARHLARIVWKQAIIFDADYEFIKRELTRERQNDVVGSAARQLRKSAVVKYPNGEDVLFPPRQKAMKK